MGGTAQDHSAPRIQKLLPESPLEDLDIPRGRQMKKLPYFQLDWFCCVWVFFVVVPFPHKFSQRMGTEGRGRAAGAGQPQPVRANRRDNTRGCAGPARGGGPQPPPHSSQNSSPVACSTPGCQLSAQSTARQRHGPVPLQRGLGDVAPPATYPGQSMRARGAGRRSAVFLACLHHAAPARWDEAL